MTYYELLLRAKEKLRASSLPMVTADMQAAGVSDSPEALINHDGLGSTDHTREVFAPPGTMESWLHSTSEGS